MQLPIGTIIFENRWPAWRIVQPGAWRAQVDQPFCDGCAATGRGLVAGVAGQSAQAQKRHGTIACTARLRTAAGAQKLDKGDRDRTGVGLGLHRRHIADYQGALPENPVHLDHGRR